jgi:alpha-ketoglutarate-dependent taurine dioxygenase
MTAAVEIELAGSVLRVRLQDGRRVALHALQLRDGCPCGECRHEGTGQRLLETSRIPLGLTLERAQLAEGGSAVQLAWSDGHAATFAASLLTSLAPREEEPRLWGAELGAELPAAAFEQVASEEGARLGWLAAIAELGFALLRDVPCESGMVCRVAELFGYVRETNYGRFFDVRTVPDPVNLADTNLGLGLHTDNPYRDPVPTLQLLHCLVASGEGGETVLVDGFNVVGKLSERSRSLLSEIPVRYEYESPAAVLASAQPVLLLGADGAPRGLRVNNRSKRLPLAPVDAVPGWYAAYAELAALLEAEENAVRLRLGPGDLLCFDNERVLHGRTAFTGGERLLQGCYADRDGLRSTLTLLRLRAQEAQWANA